MTEYRIVELRPDVYSVERYLPIAWFLWWIKDWQPVKSYNNPKFPEYSPMYVTEFTLGGAEQYVSESKEMEELEWDRKNPPNGFPRIL